VIWGSGDFLSRKSSEQIGAFQSAAYVQPVGLVLMGITLLVSGNVQSLLQAASHPTFFALNLLLGILAFAGLAFLFRGYAYGVMSVVAPIAGSYPAVSVLLAVVILGSAISPQLALAIVGVLVGIVLSGVKLSEFHRNKNASTTVSEARMIKGVDSGLATCLLAGVVLFGVGIIAGVFGSFVPVFLLKITETITALLLFFPLRKKMVLPNFRTMGLILIIGAADAVGFVCFGFAIMLSGADLPIIVTLSGLTGIVTVLLARVFLKERLEKIQAVGIFIIFASVATILYF